MTLILGQQLFNTPMYDANGVMARVWKNFFQNLSQTTILQATGTVSTIISTDLVWTDLAGVTVSYGFTGGTVMLMASVSVLADAMNSDYDLAFYDGDDNQVFGIHQKNPFANVGNNVAFNYSLAGPTGQFTYKLKARVRQAGATVVFGLPSLLQVVKVQ